jgi:poly(3-hydroxybutyrate) depolymerase
MIRTQVAFVILVVAVLAMFGAEPLAGDELPADRISVADVLADPSAEEQAARAAMLEAVNARRQQLEQQIRQSQGRERRAVLPGMGELKTPEHLDRREIEAGARTREYFLFVPNLLKGTPAPVVFALHGGAANSGLQMHYKADYTVVAEREGFVVYPSGVRGWPGVPANVSGPKTQDISAPEEFWSFLRDHRLPE